MAQVQQVDKSARQFASLGQIDQLAKTGWSKIPTYYYDVTQRHFPLTNVEFNTGFGGTVPIFNETQNQPGRQSNAETGSGVNEPFLALGVGVVAIAENFSFTLPGALADIDRSASPSCIPQIDGCEGDEANTSRNATLYWGGPGWNFINAFFQRYRLQMMVNKRFQLVDEALFDVGMVPTPSEFVGASSSLIPGMPYVRWVNDVLADKTSLAGKVFLPQDIAGTVCVGAPTAAVTYGHPRIIGLSNRMYCFNQPIPIMPGMRFDVNFTPVENDNSFLEAMRRESVLDPANPTNPDAAYTTDTICSTGITGSAYNVPGGTVSIGLVFKGYALQPSACVQYVTEYMIAGSALSSMVYGASAAYLSGLAQIRELQNLVSQKEETKGMSLVSKLAGLLAAPR
jgi:hypothetical protein